MKNFEIGTAHEVRLHSISLLHLSVRLTNSSLRTSASQAFGFVVLRV